MARAIDADISRQVDAAGHVWFSGDTAAELLLRGYDIATLLIETTADIVAYNQQCERFDKTAYQICSSPSNMQRPPTWWIDEPFRNMPVRETILQRCQTALQRDRVNQEMDLFEERDLLPVLRLMFMLVDHFRRNNIVWGVGRGSSVASYVLYLIGIHKIDSLRYNLQIDEFLR